MIPMNSKIEIWARMNTQESDGSHHLMTQPLSCGSSDISGRLSFGGGSRGSLSCRRLSYRIVIQEPREKRMEENFCEYATYSGEWGSLVCVPTLVSNELTPSKKCRLVLHLIEHWLRRGR